MYYLSKIVRGGKITAGKWAGGGIGIRAALRTLSPKGLWVRVPPCPPKVFIPSGKRWRFLSPHKNSDSGKRLFLLPPREGNSGLFHSPIRSFAQNPWHALA